MKKDLSLTLADFPSLVSKHGIPASVLEEAKRRVLDSLGCYAGAYSFKPSVALRKALLSSSSGPCQVWGTPRKVSPEIAALINGAGVRTLDYNDTYLSLEPCHPSDLMASFWAALEMSGGKNQGRRLLKAMVLGYDVMCRLCDAGSLRLRGFDHVTYLPIASAVGCSYILGLNKIQTRNAVALALTGQTALRQTRVGEISDWKAACAAHAARSGLWAAQLAREGFTGAKDVFKGKHGFEAQVSGPLHFKMKRKTDPWKILSTHTKFFPAEHHSQSAIEAALLLRPLVNLKAIQKITLKTFDVGVDIIGSEKEKWLPETRETADHSLPYLVAVSLLDGGVTLRQYERKRFLNSKVRSLMKKIQVRRDARFNKTYPKDLGVEVAITLTGGRILKKTVLKPKGYAGNPMAWEDVILKFGALASPALPKKKQAAVVRAVRHLEKGSKLARVSRLLEELS